MPQRPDRIAIMRPAWSTRFLVAAFTCAFTPIPLLIANTSRPSDLAGTIWIAPLWGLCGLLFNSVVNQGAWIRVDVLILETVLGRARIELEAVDEIHLHRSQTLMLAKVGNRYIRQDISAPMAITNHDVTQTHIEWAIAAVHIPLHWHDDVRAMLALEPQSSASFERGAIVSTLMRPWVIGMTVAGVGMALLLA